MYVSRKMLYPDAAATNTSPETYQNYTTAVVYTVFLVVYIPCNIGMSLETRKQAFKHLWFACSKVNVFFFKCVFR